MPRLHVSFVALLVLVACGMARPLYDHGTVADEGVMGGKGFVSARVHALAPPMSLTASDGSGLRLLSLHADATIDDPLATTELELRFRNPKAEVIEGKFELSLPPGAAITRFAMMVGTTWQEAEVVERQKGRVVYESFLHEQRDPALLEQETGNRFSVRVFPIAASGEARLRVSYVQAFDEPTLPYRLSLRGLPSVGEIDARVGVKQAESGNVVFTEHHLEGQRPREDFVVARDADPKHAWRDGDRVIARIVVPAAQREQEPPRSFVILFDTSASRALEFHGKVEQLRDVVAQLGRHVDPAAQLSVLPFDQSVGEPVYAGPLSGFADSDAQSKILRRQALGASDLERALQVAAKQEAERVVVITDGMITAGKRDPAALRDALRRMADAGTRRLDVVAGRDRRDDDVLGTLVTGDLPQSGVVIDATRTPEEIAMRLVRPTAPATTVRVAGAKHVWPDVLRGVQAGDAVLVYADVDRAGRTVDVTLDAKGIEPVHQRLPVTSAKDPAFTQAWMRADVGQQLAALALSGDPNNAVLRKQLAELSVEHRILNELTAFIVLETEEDYARFGIERSQAGEGDAPAFGEPESEPPPPEVIDGKDRAKEVYESDEGAPMGSPSMAEPPLLAPDDVDADDAPVLSSRRSGRDEISAPAVGIARERKARVRKTRARKPAEVTLRRANGRSGLDDDDAEPIGVLARLHIERCWFVEIHRRGAMTVELHIDREGRVTRVDLLRNGIAASSELRRCMDQTLRSQRFMRSGIAGRRARYTYDFRPGHVYRPGEQPHDEVVEQLTDPDRYRTDEASYEGTFAEVKRLLRLGELAEAQTLAWSWRRSAPDDLLALLAVGEVAKEQGRTELAARAFGSIAELYPSNAPMLRFAAGRLEALGAKGLPLAVDVLEEAQRQRPDHPTSHRALAWALVERRKYAAAFDALARGYDNVYPDDRFASAVTELGEELRIVAAAWVRAEPKKRATIEGRLGDLGLTLSTEASLRFVLSWETDTNDVDLHVQDGHGSRAWYGNPQLESGGMLLADVTNGYGPESFVIDGEPLAYPYYIAVHYYANGPMGYGMGHVQAIHHDGRGNLDIETIPFVAMKQDAKLLVGAVHRK